MTVRAAPKPLASLTEKDWTRQLFETKRGVATQLGWTLNFHVLYARGASPGFPDWVLARDRLLFVELKTSKGVISGHQVRWLTGLAKAGCEVYVWRPEDLDEAGRVLGKRWIWDGTLHQLHTPGSSPWRPGSLWLPAGCRADEREDHGETDA